MWLPDPNASRIQNGKMLTKLHPINYSAGKFSVHPDQGIQRKARTQFEIMVATVAEWVEKPLDVSR